MANLLYDTAREGFLTGLIDWDTATIGVYLVRNYTFSATHTFVSDITNAGGIVVAGPVTLTNKTATGGVADANDVTFSAVPTGPAATAIIIAQRSAVTGGSDVSDSAKRLICYIDTASGLPVTPNGGDITVQWDNGSNKIFRL